MNAPTLCTPTGDLTIFEIAEFKVQLQAAMEQGQGVTVDLSQIDSLDASALQLLMAACRSDSVQFLNLPARVSEQLARLGWPHTKE